MTVDYYRRRNFAQSSLEKQTRVLESMKRLMRERPFIAPSIRELRDDTGISSTSVVQYALEGLQDRGLVVHLSYGGRLSRAWVPTFELGSVCPLCGWSKGWHHPEQAPGVCD